MKAGKGYSMRRMVLVVIAVAALASACNGDMPVIEKGNRQASRKVLIASTGSEFKTKMIAAVVENLGPADYYLKIGGLDLLKTEDLSRYQVIVVASGTMAGSIDGRAAAYFDAHRGDPKTIAYVTRGSKRSSDPITDAERKLWGADALTSASTVNEAAAGGERLSALIRSRY